MSFPSNTKISELLDLRAKTAIVTGGAMGIGQAIAARLAGEALRGDDGFRRVGATVFFG